MIPSLKHLAGGILATIALTLATNHLPAQRIEAVPLPLEYSPTGVLFRVKAPGAQSVFVAGTFNGWGGSDGSTISDPSTRMYGPDENGVFEYFVSLTPGTHVFKYAINGNQWIPGPPNLPRMKDDFDTTPGQGDQSGSAFDFSLEEPPWPSYVPTVEMMPAVVIHQETGEPFLRVRFFSRYATTAHIVGGHDGWGGISNRAVFSDWHKMQPTRVPNVWQKYIGPLKEGFQEYKIVANNRQWLSDPSVSEMSQDGNTMIRISKATGTWQATYTPRFDPNAKRQDTKSRWGNDLVWEDDRNTGFAQAQLMQQRMLWVISLPQSGLSESLMKNINGDAELVGMLSGSTICLETPAHEVLDIIRGRMIQRLPYVVLVDSSYRPVWEKFNPGTDELKEQLRNLK
ncbi:MAG: glycogen-binding domain-containing protein [Candidatus Sumerlaeia bacterium]|nr:glycogen-binding domain-containing protein [Candidatus Sumerlaeia bacterium]